jgi:hypothetical protein
MQKTPTCLAIMALGGIAGDAIGPPSLWLVGMMERAWLVGAETTIEAAAGRDVRVTVC